MATDEVDDGRARTSSVVEIGQAVRQTWPEMEKGGSGFSTPCAHSRRQSR
jgi:hypothetical protein